MEGNPEGLVREWTRQTHCRGLGGPEPETGDSTNPRPGGSDGDNDDADDSGNADNGNDADDGGDADDADDDDEYYNRRRKQMVAPVPHLANRSFFRLANGPGRFRLANGPGRFNISHCTKGCTGYMRLGTYNPSQRNKP